MAVFLTAVGMVIHQLESVLIKLYNRKYTKGGFLFTGLISLFAMVFFAFTDTDGFSLPKELLPYTVAAGILFCGASILTYLALGWGSFVLSNLILSYSLLISIGYGIFWLGESASILTWGGIGLMLVSLYLVRGGSQEEGMRFSWKWLVAILLSSLCSGLFSVLRRVQQLRFADSCTHEFMLVILAISACVLLAVGAVIEGKDLLTVLKACGGYAALAGLANGASNLVAFWVELLLPISVLAPTRSGVQILLSFAISRFLFQERFLKRQILGVVLGAVALVLLNL